jgi:hypothetical protein
MTEPNVAIEIGAHVTQELLDRLREAYPMLNPNLHDPERLIWIRAGEQRLIEFLAFCRQEFITPQEGA